MSENVSEGIQTFQEANTHMQQNVAAPSPIPFRDMTVRALEQYYIPIREILQRMAVRTLDCRRETKPC